jgi:hypothetical protein
MIADGTWTDHPNLRSLRGGPIIPLGEKPKMYEVYVASSNDKHNDVDAENGIIYEKRAAVRSLFFSIFKLLVLAYDPRVLAAPRRSVRATFVRPSFIISAITSTTCSFPNNTQILPFPSYSAAASGNTSI